MTEWVAHALEWLGSLGYFGIMLALMIEVIPSEIVLAWAGYLVSQNEIGWAGAVVAGTIGGTLAQIFLYWLGRYGGRPVLERYGKYLFIRSKHLDVSERWFDRHGVVVIFTARFIPVVRHAISIPAGMARMPLFKFTLYTALAVIPWSILFVMIGYTLGENWQSVSEQTRPFMLPFIGIVVLLIGSYFIWQIWRGRKLRARK